MSDPVLGQLVTYRTSETRTAVGIVTLVTNSTRVNFTAVADTADDWPVTNIPTTIHPAHLYEDVDKGSGVGEWQECDLPAPVADAVNALIASATAVPAGSVVSLALNTARQPSTTRATRIVVSGTWTTSVTASGVVALKADGASTPTTVVDDAQPAVTLAVGVGITLPWKLVYDLPAGHFYQVATSGGGAFAITHINETAQ